MCLHSEEIEMHPPALDDRGFTLIEVMIAIMVLAIGLIGAAVMQVSAVNTNANAFHMTRATSIGLDQIENLMSLDATDSLLDDNNAVGAGVNFQRMGIVGNIGPLNNLIQTVNDTADNSIVVDNYTVFYDGTPNNDPVNATQVGIDMRVYVVWNEGSRLRTVEMNFTKVL